MGFELEAALRVMNGITSAIGRTAGRARERPLQVRARQIVQEDEVFPDRHRMACHGKACHVRLAAR